MRLRIAFALLATMAAYPAAPLLAQDYPSKPIRIVVPYPPGGSLDILARAVSPKLNAGLGVPVIVESRAGASGVIGSEYLARSAPDGYTIGVGNASTHWLPVALGKKLPYDPVKDFTPLSALVKNISSLVVNSQFPVRSVKELVDYARKNPGKVSFSTPGTGTSAHLIGEMLNQIAGIELVHVPYRGSGPALTDLLGGQVLVGISSTSTVMPYVKNGRIRVLAVLDEKRYAQLPDIPTGSESLPGFAPKATLTGMFGPAGMAHEIVSRLNAELVKAVREPDIRSTLEANAFDVVGSTPEEFSALIRSNIEQWSGVVRARHIHAD